MKLFSGWAGFVTVLVIAAMSHITLIGIVATGAPDQWPDLLNSRCEGVDQYSDEYLMGGRAPML